MVEKEEKTENIRVKRGRKEKRGGERYRERERKETGRKKE